MYVYTCIYVSMNTCFFGASVTTRRASPRLQPDTSHPSNQKSALATASGGLAQPCSWLNQLRRTLMKGPCALRTETTLQPASTTQL